MKTLYININSERIESSDTLDVLAYDLINDFYFALGEKLLARFSIAGVDKIKLFTEYMDARDASGADSILEQWSQLKARLFGESPQGAFTFHLPDSYLSWLKYNENTDYCRLAETLPSCIDIDLEEFYEDSIDSLRRRIFRYLQKDDRYNEIDEIVFNDYAVGRKSEIVRQIKARYEVIKFVLYEKWVNLSSSQIIQDEVAISFKQQDKLTEALFPVYGVTLGQTKLNELNANSLSQVKFTDGTILNCYEPKDAEVYFYGFSCRDNLIAIELHDDERMPKKWRKAGLFWGISEDSLKSFVKKYDLVIVPALSGVMLVQSKMRDYMIHFYLDGNQELYHISCEYSQNGKNFPYTNFRDKELDEVID